VLGGVVRGRSLILRVPAEDDLPLVNAWMADMRVRRGGRGWDEPATPATWKERLAEAAKDRDSVLWTIEAAGRAIGTARISLGHHAPPSSWMRHFFIDPAAWGRGYGWDAALALHRYVFDYLDHSRTMVELPADNAAGLAIARKLGYEEGARGHEVYYRDGRYTDDVWLRLERATWDERWSATEREYPPVEVDAS
jgi:RimJ/RimL family protein N-acetyltransferase